MDWEKFSKEELQDAINQFVDKITVRFDHEKTEHIVIIKFKLPLVDDNLDYKDPDDKSKGYKVGKGNEELQGNLPFKKGGRVSQKNPPLHHHSSVTFVRCDDASSTADLTSNFTLTCRSPALTGNHYSEHQLLLYQTITEHREQGMNFNAIAEWLNNEGYLTVRGKKFRGAHVHSILKKRLVKKELLNREHPPVWSEFSMEVVDKTILMSDFGFPD